MEAGLGLAHLYGRRPLILGHRGASAYAPENTLRAFALALEQGAGGVELDVTLSADGVPMVIHDDTVDRTTNGRGPVNSVTQAALQQLDAGFQTRFGKLGMMVCYDGFFPEVARELSNRGAEVIAWPVWGCNPILASARACENHVYLVSSTYEDASRNWMLSAVWDHQGNTVARAEKFGSVIVSEVNLDQRLQWPSLGDFKADLLRHRPLARGE